METATEEVTHNEEDLNIAINEESAPEPQIQLIPIVGVIRAQAPTIRGQWATVALNDVLVRGERTDYRGERVEYVRGFTVWVQWQAKTLDEQFFIEDMIAQNRHAKVQLLVEKTSSTSAEGKTYTNFLVHSIRNVEGTPDPVDVTVLGETNIHPS